MGAGRQEVTQVTQGKDYKIKQEILTTNTNHTVT